MTSDDERAASLALLTARIADCRACDRLVEWRERVAREKRASYKEWDYWGRPITGFGDPDASLLVLGLAPAAHGGNRTGRVFTGDRSGDWLFSALHRAGYANQPTSLHRDDGLRLKGCYVFSAVRCAPPENKPTNDERDNCLPFAVEELSLLANVRAIVCLGNFAWEAAFRILSQRQINLRPRPRFAHLSEAVCGPYTLIGSYHPSQQNTFTGRLTEPMLDAVFTRARQLTTLSTRPCRTKPKNRNLSP